MVKTYAAEQLIGEPDSELKSARDLREAYRFAVARELVTMILTFQAYQHARAVGAARTSLDELARSSDPLIASRALNLAGVLESYAKGPSAGAPYYRQALATAPDYADARENLEKSVGTGAPTGQVKSDVASP